MNSLLLSPFTSLGLPPWPRSACFPPLSLPTFDLDELLQPPDSECKAYELYTHLPKLSSMWNTRSWPFWVNEEILRPALQGLELNFRMIFCVLCDLRPYVNKAEWVRRLEVLVKSQLEIICLMCEEDLLAPVTRLSVSTDVLGLNERKRLGAQPLVSKSSRDSLLPRLACSNKAQDIVAGIHLAIECCMLRAPFTLGLGEPNLSGKPVLDYDAICKPAELYECRQSMKDHPEDHMLSTAHQIMECWLFVTQGFVKRLDASLHKGELEEAAKRAWAVERIWRLISSTLDLLAIMDPDDLVRLTHELAIGTFVQTDSRRLFPAVYCLRSNLLRVATKACKHLRHFVPKVVGVEADPKGGPRLQEAIMELFHTHALPAQASTVTDGLGSNQAHAVHVLQAFQAIETSVRKFYFSYHQLIMCVLGSGGFKGSCPTKISASDALSYIYSEPPYFPSVDGAKTFLADFWHYDHTVEEGSIIKELVQRASKSSSTEDDDSEDFLCAGVLSEDSMS